MLGAVAGDIIGSVYEWDNMKSEEFPLFTEGSHFTDDSVMTVALADALLRNLDYAEAMKDWGRRYPDAGYGGNFSVWLKSEFSEPYNSWGNGSAMRVSPVGYIYDNLEETLSEAARSAEVTHNHPEGIKGARAAAAAIFLGRIGKDKEEIKEYIQKEVGYDLSRSLDEIRPGYTFDVSCQGTLPVAIRAFLESDTFEDAVRKAVSVGGDSDTIACITGSIAEAYYKDIPGYILEDTLKRLPADIIKVLKDFQKKYVEWA